MSVEPAASLGSSLRDSIPSVNRRLPPDRRREPLPAIWLAVALGVAAAIILPLGLLSRGSVRSDLPLTRGVLPGQAATARPPPCAIGDVRTPFSSHRDWARTLLDTTLRLPSTYEPGDLVSTRTAGFNTAKPIRRLVIGDLAALRAAAEGAGNPIDVTWGYRSFRTQRWVFEYWSKRKGRDATLLTAARAGHSEHQLGTSLDFKSEGTPNVDRSWRFQPAGVWMRENAWRFGFIESYPLGKEALSCYEDEPWHYRYFGRALAAKIHASGLTTREYLWKEAALALAIERREGPSGRL
jgi:LAS superfamily LD-carboxypeptidase LdcB